MGEILESPPIQNYCSQVLFVCRRACLCSVIFITTHNTNKLTAELGMLAKIFTFQETAVEQMNKDTYLKRALWMQKLSSCFQFHGSSSRCFLDVIKKKCRSAHVQKKERHESKSISLHCPSVLAKMQKSIFVVSFLFIHIFNHNYNKIQYIESGDISLPKGAQEPRMFGSNIDIKVNEAHVDADSLCHILYFHLLSHSSL